MSFGTISNRNELIGCYIDPMKLFKIKTWGKNPIGKATPSSNKKMGIKRGLLCTSTKKKKKILKEKERKCEKKRRHMLKEKKRVQI